MNHTQILQGEASENLLCCVCPDYGTSLLGYYFIIPSTITVDLRDHLLSVEETSVQELWLTFFPS